MPKFILPVLIWAAMQSSGVQTYAQEQAEMAVEADPQTNIMTYCTPYDGGKLEMMVLTLIQSAKHKIRFCAYGFTDDMVAKALIERREHGLDVKGVMDATQAAGKNQARILKLLKAHDIECPVGHSEDKSQLIHAKFIVVDDAIVLTGSWNFTAPTASEQDNFADIIVSEKRALLFTKFWDRIYGHVMGVK